jgi:phosphate transport system protein
LSLLSRLFVRTAAQERRVVAVSQHTVASFDADLGILAGMVSDMAARVGRALADATRGLNDRDPQLAQQVIASDRVIDTLQHDIEERAVLTIAKRQPMAVDLREIVSTIRIANDLERVGDLAKNVAKRVIAIGDQRAPINVKSGLGMLAARAGEQLTAAVQAHRERSDAMALAVWRADSAIDAQFTSLFRELLTYMMEDPRSIGYCTHLLFCAKNLERVGDHATNIAETAHYVITGELITAERPKADLTSAMDPNSPQLA